MRRMLLLATLALGLVAAASAFGGAAGARTTATPLRPDIVPLPTSQVQIRYVHDRKRLYLSFETENTGVGPLEMQPVRDDCDGDGSTTDDRTALQHIYGDTDGSGAYTPDSDTVVRTVVAGCFVYHAIHGHWHFQNFARYELLALDGDRLRTHSKVGFCMLDTASVDGSLPGHPDSPRYTGCPDLALQGISVGWADTYGVNTPGQFISVDGLRNGTYCLVGHADPTDRIVESDEADNEIRARVRFGDHRAAIRPLAC
jgi:lysyl oxidase